MFKTHLAVMDELKSYAYPKARLTRLMNSGKLIQIRRGLFTDDPEVSPRLIAPVLYGPSYISFQYALAAAALIPERVMTISSASYHKNKDKVFHTPLGEFHYLYLPIAVYPYGIKIETEDGMPYLMATPEKALCDLIYKLPTLITVDEIKALLLEDWRMEKEELLKLDGEFIRWIAPRYRRKSLLALAAWFAQKEAL